MRVTLVSLEPWDDVWRRNQHLVRGLLDLGFASSVLYVEPPILGSPELRRDVYPRVTALRPRLQVPKRAGGLRLVARALVREAAGSTDVLWINDPSLGVHLLPAARPTIYDVTDDWRTFPFAPRIRRRLVRAEDRLAERATTVVCSQVLRQRWQERYGIEPVVVHNGVDVDAYASATPARLQGEGRQVGYVGTLHDERLDVDLVLELADRLSDIGSVQLVGPDCLEDDTRVELARRRNVRLTGPIPAGQVPGVLLAMDVLVAPHAENDFTRSLDAIKAYEYLASGRPIVATPTSGFQHLADTAGVDVVGRGRFIDHVLQQLADPRSPDCPSGIGWDDRAVEFAEVITACMARQTRR